MRALLLLVALLFLELPEARAQKFLPDDPLLVDRDDLPVGKPGKVELSTTYDVIEHTFLHRGPERPIPRALNVNTLGEVPDSSWFQNRLGAREMSLEELVRGPNSGDGPDPSGEWTVIAAKSGGISPGFTLRDGRGDVYFAKPDPREHPNLSTAADVIGAKFFHALGYHVPENYVAYARRERLRISPDAKVKLAGGKRRRMGPADLDAIFAGAHTRPDGAIRLVASRGLPGEDLGPHKYHGTRGDDPNDIFPHEHRRELRGYRLFCAWLNHDDSRSLNSIDMFVRAGDGGSRELGHVKHYLIDFGSILGSGSNALRQIAPQNPRAGNEYVIELGPLVKSALSFGLWERPWRKVNYREFPEIGRIEADFFRPERWRPEYPNPAFDNMDGEDAFWAARILWRFPDEAVRAIVHEGQYEDPEAERHLADVIVARKHKIVSHYFRRVNPLHEFRIGDGGAVLEFVNLGEAAGLGKAEAYEVQWFAFDNRSGRETPLGGTGESARRSLPLPRHEGAEYLLARIRTRSAAVAGWSRRIDVYLRMTGGARVVGIEREGSIE
jgi:hypothetical protein